jgi:acetylornithine deacetylase/succinyl-diaminopimelate desuccinylase-like protein
MLDDASLVELAELLAIPSVSADPAHAEDVRRAAEWVAAFVERLGGDADVRERGRLVVGEVVASTDAQTAPVIVVYGHYDVQPPEPLELWESDPFDADVRGEWLYARGATDDKGQLWMQLKAAESLTREGALPVNLRIVCDGEEETGGDAVVRFLEEDERGADAAVIFDGWMSQRDAPEFVTAARGLIGLDIECRTGERDLHSGHYGGAALNATHALTQALTALYPKDGRLPDPLRRGIRTPTQAELTPLAGLPSGMTNLERVGAVPLDERAADEFYERTWFEPSLDVTAIRGGKPGLRNTTIFSSASAQVTIRVAPEQDAGRIAEAAERLLREAAPAGTELGIAVDVTPPAKLGIDSPVIRLASDAFERVFGRRPLLTRVGGTLPILAGLAGRGIPTVMTGLGLPESNTHAPNERMLLETLPLGIAAARETYLSLAALGR